jgi:hypothetical protein
MPGERETIMTRRNHRCLGIVRKYLMFVRIWTMSDEVLPHMLLLGECEEKYGEVEVEECGLLTVSVLSVAVEKRGPLHQLRS